MSRTVRISDRLYAHIQEHATPFEDTPRDVIERLLGIAKEEDTIERKSFRAVGAGQWSRAKMNKYRNRYPGEREATFDVYCDLWEADPELRSYFDDGFTTFTRCANAEPACQRDMPEKVARAEEIMRRNGYIADDSGRPGRGRMWNRDDARRDRRDGR